MGSCCESCAQAARATTCEPCAADVGALFEVARRPELVMGSAPGPAGPEWTTPIAEMLASPELQPKIPAARLYAAALSELARPEVRGQMSIFGALSAEVLTTAARVAATATGNAGVDPGALLDASKALLMSIYDALPASSGAVMDALAGLVGKGATGIGAAVAEALPIIGAFVSFVTSVEDFYAAKAIADARIAALVCQQSYRTPVATRAAVYGGMTPADLMQASVGDVFSAMESAMPERAAQACASNKVAKAAIEATGLVCGRFIPAETRRVLRILRLAVQNSWNDQNSDAGLGLWPAYLDLVHAQFKQDRIDRHWAAYLVDKEVLPARRDLFGIAESKPDTSIPEHQLSRMHLHRTKVTGINVGDYPEDFQTPLKPGKYARQFSGGKWRVAEGRCLGFERRALDEFISQLQEWELFIDPTYKMDQAKAAQLRGTIDTIVRSVSGGSLKFNVSRRAAVDTGQRAALAQQVAANLEKRASASSSSSGVVVLAAAVGGAALLLGGLK